MIQWSQDDLAKASGVAKRTIASFEAGSAQPHRATISAIRRALEDAGIRFIEEDDHGGPGVRLRGSRDKAPRYNDNEALTAISVSAIAFLKAHPDAGMSFEELVGHAVIAAGSSVKAAQQLYFEQSKFFERLISEAQNEAEPE